MEPSKLEDTTVKSPFLSAAIANTTSTTYMYGSVQAVRQAADNRT